MYYVKKLLSLCATVILVTILAFLAFSVIPGDAALLKLGTDATPEQVEALREEMGLDRNVVVRYFDWIGGVVKGDFGESSYYNMPVADILGERIAVTLLLALIAIIMIVVVSFPVAVLASRKEYGITDRAVVIGSEIFISMPAFFLGMLIILIFGLTLKVFTVGGYVSYKEDFAGFMYYMIFPALAIAIPKTATVVKFLRSNIIKEKNKDYVRTLRAMGTSERTILWRHVLKNAMIPTITFIGLVIVEVVAGSVIVEQVFSVPGLGRQLCVSIGHRDYNLVQAIVLFLGVSVVVINFVVDMLYHVGRRDSETV
ncbi:MAG: ABC transporter permease [Lachnospiraceae bacterium]|nr:ABC transporter permease [Lachnospiraceae bacterium]